MYEEGDASYQNVAVVHDICVPNVELLRTLATAVQPGSAEGDFLDAGKKRRAVHLCQQLTRCFGRGTVFLSVCVASHILTEHTGGKK